MPFFGDTTDLSNTPDVYSGGIPTQQQNQTAADAVVPRGYGILQTLGGDAALALPDLVDTVASSKLVSPVTGLQRGDVNRQVLDAMDLPGVTNFANNNQAGIQAMSGIAGMVASELIARKITAPAGVVMKTLSTLPYVRRIATLDSEYSNAMSTVRNVDSALAQRGVVGVESYVGNATVDGLQWTKGAAEPFAQSTFDISRNRAVFNAKGFGALKGIRDAAVTEGVMAAALNQNGFLYDDSAAHNLAWQALGLGLGAGGEWLHSGYEIRKFVNSDEIRRGFASALDPNGTEEARLLYNNKPTDITFQSDGGIGGSRTDSVTSYLTSASQLSNNPIESSTDAAALLSNRQRLATQHMQIARDEMQKVTVKGVDPDGRTRFSMDAPFYGNHVDMVMKRDPAGFYGIEEIGGIPDNNTAVGLYQVRNVRLDERIAQTEAQLNDPANTAIADQLTSLRNQLAYKQTWTPQVLIDGERMPITEAAGIEQFPEPKIIATAEPKTTMFPSSENPKTMWEAQTAANVAPVSIDSDMTIHIPSGRDINTADHFDILRLYRAAHDAINTMSKFTNTIQMPLKPNWFQLDMAERIIQQSEGEAKIAWPPDMTRDSAQVESIAQKAEAMKAWQSQIDIQNIKSAGQGVDPQSILSKLRVRFNLPKMTAYERGVLGENSNPADALLRGVTAYGPDQVRNMSVDDLKQGMAEFKRLGDMAPVSKDDMQLTGNSFNYMLDESGKPIKPILMYARPMKMVEWSADTVAERLAARKMAAVGTMLAPDAGPLTKMLTEAHLQSADFERAANPQELVDSQVQGSVTGSSNQTPLGAVEKAGFSSDFRDRDNPILLAASRLYDSVGRVTRDYMRQVITDTFGDSQNVINSPRNISSNALLNQFHSYRGGWDLGENPVPVSGDGNMMGFQLGDTAKNRARWKQLFNGADMPTGQTLITPEGRQVVLDPMAMDLQKRFNIVTDAQRVEKNTLLKANGMPQIERVPWYVPPPNTNGKYIGFVIGADGKPIKGVVADTPHEFNAQRRNIESQLPMGQVFRTQQEIHDFANIWDRAQMDMINPGTTAVQPGKVNKGILRSQQVDLGAFNDSMQYLRDQYLAHANDITTTLMKEQLNAAKARANMAEVLTKNRGNPSMTTRYKSIYDMYVENLTGRNKLQSDGSIVGKFANPVEGFINDVLTQTTPTASTVWNATNGWLNRANPWSKTKTAAKDFVALTKALGPYMPFESAADLIEKRGIGARPWTAAGIGGKLNQFAATVLLRVAEVGQPIMNMAGIVNAMPAVIRQFSQQAGESVEDYAARIGHAASIFTQPDGTPIGIADMGKIGASALRRAWDPKSEADYAYMMSRGYITQEVAEFHRQFGAIESRSDWQKFFLGDPSIKNPQGIKQILATKGVVGWMSALSDKSEDLSRSWGHMVGLEVADHLGIVDQGAKHSFAHDMANKMIANYAPQNRPEIFQGALGAPLGLFQSFIMNYYERMFRYVETKDYQSLITQYATQGALFGVTTVPGWNEFNSMMAAVSPTGKDPTSAVNHEFPGPLGDLLAGGVLSNLPVLFSGGLTSGSSLLPGVDLYSRGDTSVRLPGSVAVPAFAIIGKIYQGIGTAIQAFSGDNPALSRTQIAEIVSNAIPNRPIAGIIEQFAANGNHTDQYGQLVTQTQGALEAAYRLIGLRSERQSREITAYYANKNAMSHKAAADDVLRLATRAAVRGGNEDALPGIYHQYLQNGGDPAQFRRWLKQNVIAATSTRGQRQLDAAMKDPNRMNQVVRLLDAGVTPTQDENTPDPTTMYGQADQGDSLSQPTTGLGTYPGQMTIDNPGATLPGQ